MKRSRISQQIFPEPRVVYMLTLCSYLPRAMMSTVTPQQRSSFLPSLRLPSMDEFIDLSAFGSSSSHKSTPVHLPNTLELNDPSVTSAFAADPFYQLLFAASSSPYIVSGSSNITTVATLDDLKNYCRFVGFTRPPPFPFIPWSKFTSGRFICGNR